VIGCALEVHRALGPGLLESAYEACVAHELEAAGIAFERQLALPVRYKGVEIDCGYRLDMLVEARLVLEAKSVSDLLPIHEAQILTYMRLAGAPVGLLMNFNSRRLRKGIRRFVL
jgi:GxxExxY protein